MTSRIIFNHGDWTITQDPTMAGRDDLVRFRKHNGQRCLLDQIAQWDGSGWGSSWSLRRWVPKAPKVPAGILVRIEAHMRRQEQRSEKTPGSHPQGRHDASPDSLQP